MDRSDPSASGTALACGIASHGPFLGLLIFAAGFLVSGRPPWQALGELASALGAMLALALAPHRVSGANWQERSLSPRPDSW